MVLVSIYTREECDCSMLIIQASGIEYDGKKVSKHMSKHDK